MTFHYLDEQLDPLTVEQLLSLEDDLHNLQEEAPHSLYGVIGALYLDVHDSREKKRLAELAEEVVGRNMLERFSDPNKKPD